MEIGAGAYAAAGAATAASVGLGLFNYNRGNYMMDQKLHYSRYTAGLTLACAQTNMYRQDISDLTALTCNRMDVYHSIAAMTATILTALFCPGRLGLHTPPPPGWLMGLFMVNLAATYLWLGLTMWLAMHASLRADSASTHMLTRFIRVPVPAQWMLDKARKFLSSYEEQPWREVFRIPFTRHAKRGPASQGGFNEDMQIELDAERRTRHGFDVPSWYKKEKAVDGNVGFESMMPYQARGTAPEHFEVYRELQNEWWPYDVYARLSIFLAFMHLCHCWTYMQIGHHLQETRSVFACACVVLPMSVLQQIILTLDIIPNSMEIPFQRIGPFAQWFAYIAAVIEYKRWYTTGAAGLGYVFVYIAYGIHIFYTLVLLRLCSPDATKPPEPAEAPASSWWPGSWRLPAFFQHAIWLVAPPRHLEAGLNDIVGEQRNMASGGTEATDGYKGLSAESLSPRTQKRRDVHRALGRQGESPAWFNVKVGLIAILVAWVWLTAGYTVEVINQGTAHPSLISAPGMPNNLRDPRYRPAKPGLHEPTEVGTGGAEAGPAKGMSEEAVERRLGALESFPSVAAGVQLPTSREELAEKISALLPFLYQLAAGAAPAAAAAAPRFPPPPLAPLAASPPAPSAPAHLPLRWPALFEPAMLACGPAAAAGSRPGALAAIALSRHGRGAFITATADAAETDATPFSLEGVAALGPFIAASWDEVGLLLVAATGATVECPGAPSAGRWRCEPLPGAKLPLGPSKGPFAGVVAITRSAHKDPSAAAFPLRAAVVFPGESTVTVFSRASRAAAPWLPAGEARTRAPPAGASFATGDNLLLTSADGAVARMQMGDGSVAAAAGALAGHEGHVWQATCGLPGSAGVARLALRPSAVGREPTLLLGQ